jgi:hypothetical protein
MQCRSKLSPTFDFSNKGIQNDIIVSGTLFLLSGSPSEVLGNRGGGGGNINGSVFTRFKNFNGIYHEKQKAINPIASTYSDR